MDPVIDRIISYLNDTGVLMVVEKLIDPTDDYETKETILSLHKTKEGVFKSCREHVINTLHYMNKNRHYLDLSKNAFIPSLIDKKWIDEFLSADIRQKIKQDCYNDEGFDSDFDERYYNEYELYAVENFVEDYLVIDQMYIDKLFTYIFNGSEDIYTKVSNMTSFVNAHYAEENSCHPHCYFLTIKEMSIQN